MISKSTKFKRRRNADFYGAVAKISVHLVDARMGRRFYLVSRPVSAHRSIHLEANGSTKMLSQFRELVRQCRDGSGL